MLETGAPDEEAVAAWAGSAPLPAVYEGAVKESDVAADDRYEHAADLTLVNELRARLQEVSTAEQKLAEGRTQLENETAKSAEAWKQMWARAEIEAREPAEMTGWREEHHNLISIIGEIANKERSLRSEEETIATHVEALRSTISELGLSPDSTSLQYLVAQAEEIVTDARDRAETRRTADSDLKRALASRPDREGAVATQRAALDEWEITWSSALAPLVLAPVIRPNAALKAVRAHRGLPGARQEVHGFEVRIRGIERDLQGFGDRVRNVAAGLIDVADHATLDIVEDLRCKLGVARQALTARRHSKVNLSRQRRYCARPRSTSTMQMMTSLAFEPSSLFPTTLRSRQSSIGRGPRPT